MYVNFLTETRLLHCPEDVSQYCISMGIKHTVDNVSALYLVIFFRRYNTHKLLKRSPKVLKHHQLCA